MNSLAKSITAAVLALSLSLPASADAYIERVMRDELVPALVNNGFTLHDTVETELLAEGDTQTFTIHPDAGDEVIVAGVGDWDSNDVDIFVVGAESGDLVARDILRDDKPVCSFHSRGGSYKVIVKVIDTDRPAYVRVVYATR
ncbi:MAG: hypothetical protein MUF31_04440 [Akkermansiaceae bacterium]|jgi:hypothetical protein|nr:hypothetical protein [Akkermansiaceae bacterium]